jgi:F-type H+-transporting ATPase subunit b
VNAFSHEAAAGFLGVPSIIWQAVNLALFLALLVYLLKKPAAGFFAERRETIEKTLRKAAEDRRRAEELSAELAARLGQLETELGAIKEHALSEALAEQTALAKQTEEDAARLVARASAEMESRVRTARVELAAYAGDLAIEIARDILKQNVTPHDDQRLVSEGVATLTARSKG